MPEFNPIFDARLQRWALTGMAEAGGTLDATATANAAAFNARIDDGFGDDGFPEVLRGIGHLIDAPVYLWRNGAALSGGGGAVYWPYSETNFASGATTRWGGNHARLVAAPALQTTGVYNRALALVKVGALGNRVEKVTLQGRWHPTSEAGGVLTDNYPIHDPQFEETNPGQYETDHVADVRAHVGAAMESTQSTLGATGTGKAWFDASVVLCRKGYHLTRHNAAGLLENGADHNIFPRLFTPYCDVALHIENSQSNENTIIDGYGGHNAVWIWLQRSGPLRVISAVLGPDTDDLVLVTGNNTTIKGPLVIDHVRYDGVLPNADSRILTINPTSSVCELNVRIGNIEHDPNRSTNPLIRCYNNRGVLHIGMGQWFYDAMIQNSGGSAASHTTYVVENAMFRTGADPRDMVTNLAGTGYCRVVWRNCREIGVGPIADGGGILSNATFTDGTFAGTPRDFPSVTVAAQAYGAGWNGSLQVPTKGDLYPVIEDFEARISALEP